MNEPVKVIASPQSWIEGEALEQLERVSKRPGMLRVVGMPDLHPAKGGPNGAAFLADRIYADLVGNDDGCGVSLWQTSLLVRKAKLDKIADKLNGLDEPWDGDATKWLDQWSISPTEYDQSLGTPGFGNHFIEIQAIETVFDAEQFEKLSLSKDRVCIVVHSGSRGFGESIMNEIASVHGSKGIMAESEAGKEYLRLNDHAIRWAMANRQLCAQRVTEALSTDGNIVLDICHNSVTEAISDGCRCWLHRKGAAPSDCGPVVIPGSRNDLSYIVQPVPEREEALRSLAHGAGRKIARGDAFGKLEKLYKGKDIRQNQYGGRVVCGQRQLLWEEAPECYKPISRVISDLEGAGLITVIASMHPLVTFKTSEGVEEEFRRSRKDWQQERSQARDRKRQR